MHLILLHPPIYGLMNYWYNISKLSNNIDENDPYAMATSRSLRTFGVPDLSMGPRWARMPKK